MMMKKKNDGVSSGRLTDKMATKKKKNDVDEDDEISSQPSFS